MTSRGQWIRFLSIWLTLIGTWTGGGFARVVTLSGVLAYGATYDEVSFKFNELSRVILDELFGGFLA